MRGGGRETARWAARAVPGPGPAARPPAQGWPAPVHCTQKSYFPPAQFCRLDHVQAAGLAGPPVAVRSQRSVVMVPPYHNQPLL